MFNKIIKFSLKNRLLVLTAALLLILGGGYEASILPVDVLPDLNRPRVTVITECPGLAPEEVETLVTVPVEVALNGSTGVTAIRSNSSVGLSVVITEFGWNVDAYKSRQIVAERLQTALENMPEGITPRMTPMSSVMGQILMLTVWDQENKANSMELRSIADWVIRRRLLATQGVSEVYVIGGDRKQFQVRVRTDDLVKYDVTLTEIEDALRASNSNVTGGYLTTQGPDQYLVRSLGRIRNVEDILSLVVKPEADPPILLAQVADVEGDDTHPVTSTIKTGDSSAHVKRPDGSTYGGPAVVLTVEKQPDTDTRTLTDSIQREMASLEKTLHSQYPGLRIQSLYQQKTFIDLAISNVIEALWLGAVLVVVLLALFLMNLRTTLITVLAIPLAIITTCLVFAWWGLSVNTMTLGGLAVAIGELVDDAIVDVENIFRRLRENYTLPEEKRRSVMSVVFYASVEIRNSVVYGTVIVVLVFMPLFWLSGMEGRLFAPLGIAYVTSILSSLAVSITVTPVLSQLLLPGVAHKQREHEGIILRLVKYLAEGSVRLSLRFPRLILTGGVILILVTGWAFFQLDRDFIPPFNEGAIQVNMDLMPGKSLETSRQVANNLAQQILQIHGVQAVICKTGRAESDEHAVPVNTSELVCSLDRNINRPLKEIIEELSDLISPENIPGTVAFYDQPLQHLINHLRSGTRAKIAIKIRGDDSSVLRSRATRVTELLQGIQGMGNLRTDPIQIDIRQVQIRLDRDQLAQYGLRPEEVNRTVEIAMNGSTVTTVLDAHRYYDVLVRLSDRYRENLEELAQLPIRLPDGGTIPLSAAAEIDINSYGPAQIDHEAGRPQLIIQANPKNRGAVEIKEEIESRLAPYMSELTADNVEVELAGVFQSEQDASMIIMALTSLAMFGVFLVLFSMFRSANLALQIMAILPFALVGGVVAMILTGQSRTIPNLVGMISLCGIASRNGILLMDHYFHLVRYEGEKFTPEMLIRAGRDRVAPVLMTALTSAIGLIPLTLAAHEPGREILYPVATVVVGGLLTSTLMEFFIRPALFWTCGVKAAERVLKREKRKHSSGKYAG